MRKPIRAVGICIKDNEILLMWRKKEGREYWVFPGGGVEDNEKPEESVLRELQEETTVTAKVEKLLYHHIYDHNENNWGSDQYFYLCSYISGTPKLRKDSPEVEKMKSGTNLFKPQWVSIEKLSDLLLYPLEIRDWLIEDIESGFAKTPREQRLKLTDLREK